MRNVSDKNCKENKNTYFMFSNFFSKILPFMRKCGNIWESRTGHRWQGGACAFRAGYLRLWTHTQNIYYLLPFHCNNSYKNAPHCYVVCTFPVLSHVKPDTTFLRIPMYVLFCIFCFHRANWYSSATLIEGFRCFFLSCKANARV